MERGKVSVDELLERAFNWCVETLPVEPVCLGEQQREVRVKFGESCEDAVAKVFRDLPESEGKRLLVVDAGIATKQQFAESTDKDALLGRLRINCKLRCSPPSSPTWRRTAPHPRSSSASGQ